MWKAGEASKRVCGKANRAKEWHSATSDGALSRPPLREGKAVVCACMCVCVCVCACVWWVLWRMVGREECRERRREDPHALSLIRFFCRSVCRARRNTFSVSGERDGQEGKDCDCDVFESERERGEGHGESGRTWMRESSSSLWRAFHFSPERGPAFSRRSGMAASVFLVAASTIADC